VLVAPHAGHGSVPRSFGSVSVVLGQLAARPPSGGAAVVSVSSLAASFAAGLARGAAPRGVCSGCGLAGDPSRGAVRVPVLPSVLFGGVGASAASGAGGVSVFFVGVLFLTLGAVPRRWTRRRLVSALGCPAPYIALSVSPD
jgi:hypothetical protein